MCIVKRQTAIYNLYRRVRDIANLRTIIHPLLFYFLKYLFVSRAAPHILPQDGQVSFVSGSPPACMKAVAAAVAFPALAPNSASSFFLFAHRILHHIWLQTKPHAALTFLRCPLAPAACTPARTPSPTPPSHSPATVPFGHLACRLRLRPPRTTTSPR